MTTTTEKQLLALQGKAEKPEAREEPDTGDRTGRRLTTTERQMIALGIVKAPEEPKTEKETRADLRREYREKLKNLRAEAAKNGIELE